MPDVWILATNNFRITSLDCYNLLCDNLFQFPESRRVWLDSVNVRRVGTLLPNETPVRTFFN